MEFEYAKNGFSGKLYKAQKEWNNSIIIVLQGMGCYEYAARFAELLSSNSIDASAMAYYGVDGLQKKPGGIPLEQFENDVAELGGLWYAKFGIYGTSRGAGAALLAASLMPEINCVIALWASVALEGMLIEGIGVNVVPPEYFGVVQRVSLFAATGFTAVLGVYLFRVFRHKE